MRGTLGINPVPIILRGANDFIKYCTLANFREGTTNFSGFIPSFVKFWTPLYMGGTPVISPVPIILKGSKDFIRYSLLANFQKGTSNIAGVIPIFVKFWTPFYMGSTPKIGPIGLIFKLDLLVVLKSICVNFGSDCLTPSTWKVFTDGQTDGHS